MHADIRTSWVSWVTLFGYLLLCGLMWASTM
jgi:hypothetical protein